MTTLRNPIDITHRLYAADARPRVVAAAPSRFYPTAKRALDLTISVLFLIAFAPVWLVIAAALKMDSRGPVLFRQARVGRNGETFMVYKFRSMHVNNDDAAHRKFVEAFMAAPSNSDGSSYFKIKNDPRVTRVGRILRKTSLDEIPQILNVLKGEMSIVGPRPALPWEVAQYEPWQRERLYALPGITGTWQVEGRSRVSFDEMMRMDISYVRAPSMWGDISLILRTVPAVLLGTGAE